MEDESPFLLDIVNALGSDSIPLIVIACASYIELLQCRSVAVCAVLKIRPSS